MGGPGSGRKKGSGGAKAKVSKNPAKNNPNVKYVTKGKKCKMYTPLGYKGN